MVFATRNSFWNMPQLHVIGVFVSLLGLGDVRQLIDYFAISRSGNLRFGVVASQTGQKQTDENKNQTKNQYSSHLIYLRYFFEMIFNRYFESVVANHLTQNDTNGYSVCAERPRNEGPIVNLILPLGYTNFIKIQDAVYDLTGELQRSKQ